MLFISAGVGLEGVGWIKAIYPVVWGVGQIITAPLADKIGREPLIVWGMFVQVLGHIVIGLELFSPFTSGIVGSVLLGMGTAMVYPALLAAVSDAAHPSWRASSLGVYRFWRDIGYAVGAVLSGLIAGLQRLVWAVHIAGIVTFLSGIVVWVNMKETLHKQIFINEIHGAY
ncbi:MFS transporter [Niabella drilacis]|uniref:Major Facilitator Superfamily protein n=1 Tax=Niabella drilacis (strain DSM 25811 / CCM 8410 / CCUG 62505 / LMG 26954 / E90) TaxID=1285928 RepID=A0A1G6TAM8_NIADE|nr:MFS transporter [Niabella drilacis]SDD25894.1 Major Facilitator Superfamily protein [Niabella drilacis]